MVEYKTKSEVPKKSESDNHLKAKLILRKVFTDFGWKCIEESTYYFPCFDDIVNTWNDNTALFTYVHSYDLKVFKKNRIIFIEIDGKGTRHDVDGNVSERIKKRQIYNDQLAEDVLKNVIIPFQKIIAKGIDNLYHQTAEFVRLKNEEVIDIYGSDKDIGDIKLLKHINDLILLQYNGY